MRDHAVGGGAFGRRHLPVIGRRLDQHHARGSAALAHIVLRVADAAAAAGGEIAPDALAGDVLARRRIFGGDLRPVAFEFFGDQLRQPGQRALAHLRARDADDDGVVGPDHDPGIDFRRAVGGADDRGAAEGKIEAEREAGAGRGGADDEGAAVDARCSICLFMAGLLRRSRRRGSLRAPAGRCRSGRCWSSPRRYPHRSASACP